MEHFITKIKIEKVRHLDDIEICLSNTERRHLLITGKNGSGKTSLLDALNTRLNAISYNHWNWYKRNRDKKFLERVFTNVLVKCGYEKF